MRLTPVNTVAAFVRTRLTFSDPQRRIENYISRVLTNAATDQGGRLFAWFSRAAR